MINSIRKENIHTYTKNLEKKNNLDFLKMYLDRHFFPSNYRSEKLFKQEVAKNMTLIKKMTLIKVTKLRNYPPNFKTCAFIVLYSILSLFCQEKHLCDLMDFFSLLCEVYIKSLNILSKYACWHNF